MMLAAALTPINRGELGVRLPNEIKDLDCLLLSI